MTQMPFSCSIPQPSKSNIILDFASFCCLHTPAGAPSAAKKQLSCFLSPPSQEQGSRPHVGPQRPHLRPEHPWDVSVGMVPFDTFTIWRAATKRGLRGIRFRPGIGTSRRKTPQVRCRMRGEKRFPRSLFARAEVVFIKKTASVEAGPLRSDFERATCFSRRAT